MQQILRLSEAIVPPYYYCHDKWLKLPDELFEK